MLRDMTGTRKKKRDRGREKKDGKICIRAETVLSLGSKKR
jgi:hypothetical protein